MKLKPGRIAAAALATVAVALGTLGGAAGTASADNLPWIGIYGDTINTVGDNNFCTVNISVRMETVPGSPGHLLAHYTPWGNNNGGQPCGAWVHANFYSLELPFYQDITTYVNTASGPVTADLRTGSGANQLQFSTWPFVNKGASSIVWIP
jgi:hypothetical protein